MGATHHALEDYGILLTLPHMRAYVPAFDGDLVAIVDHLFTIQHPAYLRLGLAEPPKDVEVPPYAPWRRLTEGSGSGPGGWCSWSAPWPAGSGTPGRKLDEASRPSKSGCSANSPRPTIPEEFLADVARGRHACWSLEEHVPQGSVGEDDRRRPARGRRGPRPLRHHGGQGVRLGAIRGRRSSTGASAASTPTRSSNSWNPKVPDDDGNRPRRPRDAGRERSAGSRGPILVLGASGFVGANLMRALIAERSDVYGTTTHKPAWRLDWTCPRTTSGSST